LRRGTSDERDGQEGAKGGNQDRSRRRGRREGAAGSARRASVGAEIIEALQEVREALESGGPLERRFTVRSYRFDFAVRDYGPDDVRTVRQLLGLSQPLFADFLGVDASTLRSWEQGTRPPSTMARRFMDEVAHNPEYWRGRVRESIAAVPPGLRPGLERDRSRIELSPFLTSRGRTDGGEIGSGPGGQRPAVRPGDAGGRGGGEDRGRRKGKERKRVGTGTLLGGHGDIGTRTGTQLEY
jgi:putative transcriptional regulator